MIELNIHLASCLDERKNDNDYDEAFLTTGKLAFVSVPGYWIEIEWLFADKKPNEFTVMKQLIEAAEAAA